MDANSSHACGPKTRTLQFVVSCLLLAALSAHAQFTYTTNKSVVTLSAFNSSSGGNIVISNCNLYHNRGIGKKMVEYACLMAKERGAKRVIALSTQSFGFFSAVCGFEETTKEALPEARLKLYDDSGRNAKVLVKQLG